jgi:hypothetical protein
VGSYTVDGWAGQSREIGVRVAGWSSVGVAISIGVGGGVGGTCHVTARAVAAWVSHRQRLAGLVVSISGSGRRPSIDPLDLLSEVASNGSRSRSIIRLVVSAGG